MNKEEALSKLCQYSMCNYKEQIWAPEAKELLDYWSGIDEKIKELQQENKQLKEEKEELKKWLEDEKYILAKSVSYIYEDSLGHSKFVNEDICNELIKVSDKIKELEEGVKE